MIIKHPMDLSTINLKLKNNQYKSLEGFEKDIRLIFRNCYTYNEAGSEICYLGEVLESVFNKKWIEKITHQVKQRDELKRVRDDADIESGKSSLFIKL
ncbi:Bromodomain-containing protein [Rhizophagus irregularis]|uniref:Bromodomain-containing protein n=1 Tax=Rhizophagus irregularis TaxID=588596 RepID=A0A2N1MYS2_9GLOM|nr:Bromodomain-containing protein [Rhizophagus irregularis]